MKKENIENKENDELRKSKTYRFYMAGDLSGLKASIHYVENHMDLSKEETKNKYTVTYINEGIEYHKETAEYGSVITSIQAPTKEGYTFIGWDKELKNVQVVEQQQEKTIEPKENGFKIYKEIFKAIAQARFNENKKRKYCYRNKIYI